MGYTKQNFNAGDVLKAAQLNAMDEQIAANEIALEGKQPKGDYVTKNVADETYQPKGDYVTNTENKFIIPNPISKDTFSGKKIICIGDSITYGYGVSKGYVQRLGEKLGMTVINKGLSGSVLCTGGHRTCNIGKLSDSGYDSADYVTILMGINDFDQAKNDYYKLGNIDSTDTSTIYGAVKYWCDTIMNLKKTTNAKFYFMTPIITSWNNSVTSIKDWNQSKTNVHGYTLRDLSKAIIEVCAAYEIPVIDLNLYSGLYYYNSENENVTLYGGDGIHPNDDGHEIIANSIIEALMLNPTYQSMEMAIRYSLNHLLSYVSEKENTKITYPSIMKNIIVNGGDNNENEGGEDTTISLKELKLSFNSITMEEGESKQVSVQYIPSNTTQKSVNWSSSDNNIVNVNNGTITAVKSGQATIYCVSVDNPSISASINVNVNEVASTDLISILLSEESTNIKLGKTKTLTATYIPNGTHQKGLVWEVSDNTVATITPSNDGTTCEVTAIGMGQCNVTVKSIINEEIYSQCFLTVVENTIIPLELSSDVIWNEDTQELTCSNSAYESLLNNNGTSNTAIIQKGLSFGQEIEIEVETTPTSLPYSPSNSANWSIMTIGLDREDSIVNVAKDSGYNFPQPDINIYFDHPGKEQNGNGSICMFATGGRLAKKYLNVCVHDDENNNLRVVFKRDNNGEVSALINNIPISFDSLKSQCNTIDLANNASKLYLVISGLSTFQKMRLKYLGDIR